MPITGASSTSIRARSTVARAALVGGLTVAVLVGVASVPLPPSAGAAPLGARDAIERLLTTRSDAVFARNEGAFMSTVDPASKAFRKRQRTLFRGLGSIDLSTYRLRADWDRYGDLARASDRKRYPRAAEVRIPVTEELYALRGFDAEPATEDMYYTYVLRGGDWFISSDTDLDDIGIQSGRHLWDAGPITTRASGRLLFLGHKGAPPLPQALVCTSKHSLNRVLDAWPAPWNRRVVIGIPSSSEELARILQVTYGLDDFVAFAASSVDPNELTFSGSRIYLNPSETAGRGEAALEIIQTHELQHVASREVSGLLMPVFVEEGLAEHLARSNDPDRLDFLEAGLRSGEIDASLPKDHEFVAGDGRQIFAAYQKSLSAVSYLVSRWGMRRFVRFYRHLGAKRVVPGTARYHLDRSLRAVIGRGARAFGRDWASSISRS